MDKEHPCPVCGEELSYDEVDIGVGIQTGNFRCDFCGWYPEQDDEMIQSEEKNNEYEISTLSLPVQTS